MSDEPKETEAEWVAAEAGDGSEWIVAEAEDDPESEWVAAEGDET